ncbi:MAG: hypothetical protein QN168_03650 [Armatimonadota bacterium]|nr:hypothetical protein [Armatimonadota bacterium]
MTAAHNSLFMSLAGFGVGWILALRALSQIGLLETMLGVTFLVLVAWALFRSARF